MVDQIAEKRSILVVEDEPAIREVIVQNMEFGGWKVHQAENGREGLLVASRNRSLDLVLFDLRMPKMGGAEFIEEFDRFDPKRMIGRILATADPSHIPRELLSRVDRVLGKPFDLTHLDDTVNEVYSKRALTLLSLWEAGLPHPPTQV